MPSMRRLSQYTARTRNSDGDGDGDESSNAIDYSEYEEHDKSTMNGQGDESFTALSENDSQHLKTIERALAKLKEIHRSDDWKRVIKQKHGVDVWVKKDVVDVQGRTTRVPMFKGEKVIEGFTPQEVFTVAGHRELWDDWYDSGDLVSDLDDSTSLTYMCINVSGGPTRTRDLALVERVEATEDETIWFCATSVESNKIPHVQGRARARMLLNGLVLRSIQRNGQPSTWMTYYLQVDAAGLLPKAIASRVMARRPVCIYKIEEHLKRSGPPAAAAAESHYQATSNGSASVGEAAVSPKQVARQPHIIKEDRHVESTLPPHVIFDETHNTSAKIIAAKRKFEDLLGDSSWDRAQDTKGSTIYMRKDTKTGLPITKGQAVIGGDITIEQILGTITSPTARQIWDETFAESHLLDNINGADHGIWSDSTKGVFPHLPTKTYSLAKAVIRNESDSSDGQITFLAQSHNSDGEASIDVSGWRLRPLPEGTTEVIHILASDSKARQIPDFIERILVTAEAAGPRRVKEFITQHGHAPFFLRWAPGQAQLDGELEDGDLTHGSVGWRIGSRGSRSTPAQVAWLQWSRKMYPNGIALTTRPEKCGIKLANIEGTDTTVQFTFDDIPEAGMIIQAERHLAGRPNDVLFNGEKITESIAGPVGTTIQREKPENKEVSEPLSNGPSKLRENDEGLQNTDALAGKDSETQVPPTKQALQSVPSIATELTTLHHTPKLADGRRALPEDAMFFITPDLYFTRQQMAAICLLVVVVWLIARYT